MTKGNPYNGDDYSHTAWENGRNVGYHSRDEVVDGLVVALQGCMQDSFVRRSSGHKESGPRYAAACAAIAEAKP